jgi:ribosome biogenesis GTPase / thiamine phosphate phosphatase
MTGHAEEGSAPTLEGVILRGVGGKYLVSCERHGLCFARPRGIFRNEGMTPLPGDRVTLGASGDPDVPFRIESIGSRRNLLVRPAMANLDLLVVVASAAAPEPDLPLVDKLLCIAAASDIDAVLCIGKGDLERNRSDDIARIYRQAGFSTWTFAFPSGEPPPDLLELLKGKTVAFAGQSGVGKSTLLNHLMGATLMATGSVSGRIGRGRHTTRHAELFPLPTGGFLADTPGFSQLAFIEAGLDARGILAGYPEITVIEGACRFTGCRHIGEKGCAIDARLASGDVDPGRLARYREFRRTVDLIRHYDRPTPATGARSRR